MPPIRRRGLLGERLLHSLPGCAALLLLLAASLLAPTPGEAVLVGIDIEVLRNGASQGTAFGGASTSTNTPLVVLVSPGDTLRFIVMLDSDPPSNMLSYVTDITGDLDNASGGSRELRFVAGSGAELSGLGFAPLSNNPNTSLNDITPTVGTAGGALGNANSVLLYRVDYIVQAPATDSLRDFNVFLRGYASNPSGDSANTSEDSASVRVDVLVEVPEPASLVLLASGLAGVAVRRRKPS